MSKTISFVASDELAKYLEEESERRLTTVSSTAQMLLAEKVREMGDVSAESEEFDSGGSNGDAHGTPQRRAIFDESNGWYEPDSDKYNFAVRVPEDADVSDRGGLRYYKTEDEAAKAITRWHE
jgi:hypothetical protein